MPHATPPRAFTLSDFDFELPEDLIAQHPAPERSASRLLDGTAATPVDRIFRDLPGLLSPGDLLVFNDTKVVKARLYGVKASGGKVELLIERVLQDHEVVAHMKVSKKPLPGAVLTMAGGFSAELLGRWPEENGPLFRFRLSSEPYALMEAHGHVPLPPYIEHGDSADDERRYQTVFARVPGAVAAPTAGLHFTERVFDALKARGVELAWVTLHVGEGTFAPMRTDVVEEHRMHAEEYELPAATAQAIAAARARGGRVVAVGTTSCRTLETCANDDRTVTAGRGSSSIFLYPGEPFRVVDLLVTNFHLPKSTLILLVAAFAGKDRILSVYRDAIERGYRFYSFGDAMLIV